MLEQLNLGHQPCFKNDVKLSGLTNINYIFGPNGSGKTTISQFLACDTPEREQFIDWKNQKHTIKVYNRNSVRTSFTNVDGAEPGVFLLGDDSREKFTQISKLENEQAKITAAIASIRTQLNAKENELNSKNQRLADIIWDKREQIPEPIFKRMAGIKGSKTSCREKTLSYFHSDPVDSDLTFETLQSRAQTAFVESAEVLFPIPLPPELTWDEESLSNKLASPIVSSAEIPLAKFIEQLSISDWVREGLTYLNSDKNKNRSCPFCQRQVSERMADDLSKLFDESYDRRLQEVISFQKVISTARQEVGSFQLRSDEQLRTIGSHAEVSDVITQINQAIDETLNSIERKLSRPSETVHVNSLRSHYESLKNVIDHANQLILEHNSIVENRKSSQKEIIDASWKIFAHNLLGDVIRVFDNDIQRLNQIISNITDALVRQSDELSKVESKLSILRRQITSSRQTIDDINSLLDLVQFQSFRLAASVSKEDGYRIIRSDGHLVDMDTLSEGERTFITFLYFYHSLNTVNPGNETEDTVAVIDDPISSLDGDIMFVVSALMRRLIRQVRDGGHARVTQVLLLTHNTRFYNEVCYQHRGESSPAVKFYRIRKYSVGSNTIEDCGFKNPIRTAYQELWDEVALAQSHPSDNMPWLPNVLRRILESYFSTLGGEANLYEIGNDFSSEERILHEALIAWSHSGSHTLIDSESYAQPSANNQRWLDAFKRIFQGGAGRHSGHYEMMMDEAQRYVANPSS